MFRLHVSWVKNDDLHWCCKLANVEKQPFKCVLRKRFFKNMQRIYTIGPFFSKMRTFFSIFKKGQGRPPTPSPSCTPGPLVEKKEIKKEIYQTYPHFNVYRKRRIRRVGKRFCSIWVLKAARIQAPITTRKQLKLKCFPQFPITWTIWPIQLNFIRPSN